MGSTSLIMMDYFGRWAEQKKTQNEKILIYLNSKLHTVWDKNAFSDKTTCLVCFHVYVPDWSMR